MGGIQEGATNPQTPGGNRGGGGAPVGVWGGRRSNHAIQPQRQRGDKSPRSEELLIPNCGDASMPLDRHGLTYMGNSLLRHGGGVCVLVFDFGLAGEGVQVSKLSV